MVYLPSTIKNGLLKAKGFYINSQMNGKWIFYRETGQLWQIGYFKMGKKEGTWTRFDRHDQIEYEESFIWDKKIKKYEVINFKGEMK
jgi:antitoxin component YwqK of YwqJK toxin-antitoxin module